MRFFLFLLRLVQSSELSLSLDSNAQVFPIQNSVPARKKISLSLHFANVENWHSSTSSHPLFKLSRWLPCASVFFWFEWKKLNFLSLSPVSFRLITLQWPHIHSLSKSQTSSSLALSKHHTNVVQRTSKSRAQLKMPREAVETSPALVILSSSGHHVGGKF